MTDSLDQLLTENQRMYKLMQALREENKRLREVLESITGSDSCDYVSLELARKALAKVNK